MKHSQESEHYIKLFNKSASYITEDQLQKCMSVQKMAFRKTSADISSLHPAITALGVGIPAYMLGKSAGGDEEKSNRTKYLLAGAAAGATIPKLIGMLNPGLGGSLSSEDVLKLKELD